MSDVFDNEYICVNRNDIIASVKVVLDFNNHIIDVTNSHLFLGYKPVIIGIPKQEMPLAPNDCTILFYTNNVLYGIIKLERVGLDHSHLYLFIGTNAQHKFLSKLQLLFQKFAQHKINKSDPLYPSQDLYEQIRVAYSFPRKISLIFVEENASCNIFPSDLQAEVINTGCYMISLRENGKAYEQVSKIKTIRICNMEVDSFDIVYKMGKNHMRELKSFSSFPILNQALSDKLCVLVPEKCISYLELVKVREIKIGIHHLILFDITEKIQ